MKKLKYDSKGDLVRKFHFKYDSDGNRVKRLLYTEKGEFIEEIIYKYDSNGNKVEESLTIGQTPYAKRIFDYDAKNRIIKHIEYKYESKFGELQQIPQYKYTYEYEEY